MMVELNNLVKTYNNFNAVDGITLKLTEGEQYTIQGASGSGKSTLLYLIGGLETADGGEVIVNGKNFSHLRDEELAHYRNQFIGFIFQFHFLLPSMSCRDNILLPAQIGNLEEEEIEKRVIELAERLGVSHCLDKFPYQLSGGEQQRINIIRALSLRPRLLLCDEPTGNLDSENSEKVIELLRQLASEYGSTLIVVTHNDSIALKFERRIVLKDGTVCSESSPY